MTPDGQPGRWPRHGVRRSGAALALCLAVGVPATTWSPTAAQVIPPAAHAAPAHAADVPAPRAARLPAADPLPEVPFPELLPRTQAEGNLALRLDGVMPAIAVPGADIKVTVTVTNSGGTTANGVVRVRIGQPLVTRADLDGEWEVGSFPVAGPTATLRNLAAGDSLAVPVTIPSSAVPMPGAYGVLPLVVDAVQDGKSTTLATYLPFEQRKEYEPLSLSVAVPLTADAKVDLLAPTEEVREAAWVASTAPGSRLDRILSGTAGSLLTYAVDPVLLGPGSATTDGAGQPSLPASPGEPGGGAATTPSESTTTSGQGGPDEPGGPSTSVSPTVEGSASTTVSAGPAAPTSPARSGFARRLAATVKSRAVWELPRQDPDLAVAVSDGLAPDLLSRLVVSDGWIRQTLAPDSVTRVAWPARALTRSEQEAVSVAYDGEAAQGEAVRPSERARATPLVLPLADVQQAGETGDAARRFGNGPPVLAYDEVLARLVADTAAPSSAGLGQRFLAETMTILQEFPGRSRRLLVLPPRGFDPDPATLSGLLRTLRSTPWVQLVSTERLVTAAGEQDAAAASVPEDGAVPADPFARGDSPLDEARVDGVEEGLARVDGLASVFPAAPAVPAGPTAPAVSTPPAVSAAPAVSRRSLLGLLSTSWRGQGLEWQAAQSAVNGRIDSLLGGVSVVPSQVNFLAEAGTLQVTVVNELDVDVHDVHLRLVPQGRSPRLRVPTTPFVVSIPRGSRVTVKVAAEAVAAGTALVSAEVSTPDGIRLGEQDTTLTIQVQPTNGWLILGLGGAAGAVFLVGLSRTIRRNRPRVSAEDLKEIDLE